MSQDAYNTPQFIGAVLMALSSLMGAYYLTLRIREAFSRGAHSEPASRAELERLRGDIADMRGEWRDWRDAVEGRCDGGLASAHELIRRNAEHIAVLIAQGEMLERRLSEAVGRIDRIGERLAR